MKSKVLGSFFVLCQFVRSTSAFTVMFVILPVCTFLLVLVFLAVVVSKHLPEPIDLD